MIPENKWDKYDRPCFIGTAALFGQNEIITVANFGLLWYPKSAKLDFTNGTFGRLLCV